MSGYHTVESPPSASSPESPRHFRSSPQRPRNKHPCMECQATKQRCEKDVKHSGSMKCRRCERQNLPCSQTEPRSPVEAQFRIIVPGEGGPRNLVADRQDRPRPGRNSTTPHVLNVSMNSHPGPPRDTGRLVSRPLLLPTVHGNIPVTFISLLWEDFWHVQLGCERYDGGPGAMEIILVNHWRDLTTGIMYDGGGISLEIWMTQHSPVRQYPRQVKAERDVWEYMLHRGCILRNTALVRIEAPSMS